MAGTSKRTKRILLNAHLLFNGLGIIKENFEKVKRKNFLNKCKKLKNRPKNTKKSGKPVYKNNPLTYKYRGQGVRH